MKYLVSYNSISLPLMFLFLLGSLEVVSQSKLTIKLNHDFSERSFYVQDLFPLNASDTYSSSSIPIVKNRENTVFFFKLNHTKIRPLGFRSEYSEGDTLLLLFSKSTISSKIFVTIDANLNKSFLDDTSVIFEKGKPINISLPKITYSGDKIVKGTQFYEFVKLSDKGELMWGVRDKNYLKSSYILNQDTFFFQVQRHRGDFFKVQRIGVTQSKTAKLDWDEYHHNGSSVILGNKVFGVNVDLVEEKITLVEKIEKEVVGYLEGYKFPELEFKFSDSSSISTKKLIKGYTLFHSWGWWCGPCHNDFNKLASIRVKYSDKLQLIGLHMAPSPNARKFEDDIAYYKLDWKHDNGFLNEKGERHYPWMPILNIGKFPTYIIVGPDGMIKLRAFGTKEFHLVEEYLNEVLK